MPAQRSRTGGEEADRRVELMARALQAYRGDGAGFEALQMHSMRRGMGGKVDPAEDSAIILKDLEYYRPKRMFTLGEGMRLDEVDEGLKKLGFILRRTPREADLQDKVGSVEETRPGEWTVRTVKRGREATLRRDGHRLTATWPEQDGTFRVDALAVEETADGLNVMRSVSVVNTLAMHAYARDLGVPTEPTALERMMFADLLEHERSVEKNGARVAMLHGMMRSVGEETDPKRDEGLIRKALRKVRGKNTMGIEAGGLIVWMNEIGIGEAPEKRDFEAVAATLREAERTGDGWAVARSLEIKRRLEAIQLDAGLPDIK